MWELDCEEGWAPKNWCFWTVVLEKTLENPLDCKEIQPVHSEGDQPWDFFGRNDAKAETPVLWPPHVKTWLIGNDFDAGRDWGQEEKGTTEDDMAGWHHWLDWRESEWTPGVGAGQGGLACCDSWGRKESDTTEQLNWIELNWTESLSWTANFSGKSYPSSMMRISSHSSTNSQTHEIITAVIRSGLEEIRPGVQHLSHYFPILWYWWFIQPCYALVFLSVKCE